MFSGGVMVKDGTVQFMSHPWDGVYNTDKKINVKFSKGYIIGQRSPTHVRHQYILDRFTSSYDIELPSDETMDVSDATISLPGVPVKFLLPMFKKPVDESLHLNFYRVISSKIYNHFEALNHFKREALERSWRSQFYKTLMQICRDRGYNSLQLSLADEGFRSKIFRTGAEHQDFRNNAFNWLTSRGEDSITLEHNKGEIKLERADFLKYFKGDWAKFAFSLYLKKTRRVIDQLDVKIRMESDIRYMQDFIMEALVFIFDLAESAVNKRIVLYPFNAYEYGYGVSPYNNKYLPPKDDNLNEWYSSPGNPKKIGFLLDLNDQNSIDKFVGMIPILLGNLLVRPAAFIVRDPDYPALNSDECTFAFDMSGSLLPSQMVGGGTGHLPGPPETGMRWIGGSEANYKKSDFFLKWNEILTRHNTLTVHKFDDPNTFYEICRRILFTEFYY
jgi:hypothetical protein